MVIAVRTERGADGLEIVKEADTDADRARLQREADLLRRAAHPGVVEVVSSGATVLRLRHRGTSLARLGPLAPDHAAAVVRAVAEVVDALHRLGIAHTRINADHVIVDERGRPRLCGFGAAIDRSTGASDSDGSPAGDVADLGRLLDDLLDAAGDALWSPDHRGMRQANRRKRAMAGFRSAAGQARRVDPAQRLTARQFATALHDAFPDLRLPSVAVEPPVVDGAAGVARSSGFAAIPDDFDPTADLGWTDDDLWFLAVSDDDSAPDPEGAEPDDDRPVGADPYASLASLLDAEPTDHRSEPDGAPDDTPDQPATPAPAERTPRRDPERDLEELATVRIRPAPDLADPQPAGPDRRLLLAVAAAVLVVGVIAGSVIARAVKPFGSETASADSTVPDDAALADGTSSDTDPTTTVAPVPPTFPSSCEVPAMPGPDVDGDGCPEAVSLADRIATVGSVQVELGQEGDLATLADHDCDGVATPVLLRPASGEVFAFPGWSLTDPVEIEATAIVSGARSISTGAGPCPAVTVTTDDGREVIVAGPGA